MLRARPYEDSSGESAATPTAQIEMRNLVVRQATNAARDQSTSPLRRGIYPATPGLTTKKRDGCLNCHIAARRCSPLVRAGSSRLARKLGSFPPQRFPHAAAGEEEREEQ